MHFSIYYYTIKSDISFPPKHLRLRACIMAIEIRLNKLVEFYFHIPDVFHVQQFAHL